MFVYDESTAETMAGLQDSDAAKIERARRILDISQSVAAVVRYGGLELMAMIYFFEDRAVLDAAIADPSSNDWSTASVVVRMTPAGDCSLE